MRGSRRCTVGRPRRMGANNHAVSSLLMTLARGGRAIRSGDDAVSERSISATLEGEGVPGSKVPNAAVERVHERLREGGAREGGWAR